MEDDRATAHLAIFDISVIARRWINTDADGLTAVGTVNAAFLKDHHRLICLVGAERGSSAKSSIMVVFGVE